jgi:hypothetical protein
MRQIELRTPRESISGHGSEGTLSNAHALDAGKSTDHWIRDKVKTSTLHTKVIDKLRIMRWVIGYSPSNS